MSCGGDCGCKGCSGDKHDADAHAIDWAIRSGRDGESLYWGANRFRASIEDSHGRGLVSDSAMDAAGDFSNAIASDAYSDTEFDWAIVRGDGDVPHGQRDGDQFTAAGGIGSEAAGSFRFTDDEVEDWWDEWGDYQSAVAQSDEHRKWWINWCDDHVGHWWCCMMMGEGTRWCPDEEPDPGGRPKRSKRKGNWWDYSPPYNPSSPYFDTLRVDFWHPGGGSDESSFSGIGGIVHAPFLAMLPPQPKGTCCPTGNPMVSAIPSWSKTVQMGMRSAERQGLYWDVHTFTSFLAHRVGCDCDCCSVRQYINFRLRWWNVPMVPGARPTTEIRTEDLLRVKALTATPTAILARAPAQPRATVFYHDRKLRITDRQADDPLRYFYSTRWTKGGVVRTMMVEDVWFGDIRRGIEETSVLDVAQFAKDWETHEDFGWVEVDEFRQNVDRYGVKSAEKQRTGLLNTRLLQQGCYVLLRDVPGGTCQAGQRLSASFLFAVVIRPRFQTRAGKMCTDEGGRVLYYRLRGTIERDQAGNRRIIDPPTSFKQRKATKPSDR